MVVVVVMLTSPLFRSILKFVFYSRGRGTARKSPGYENPLMSRLNRGDFCKAAFVPLLVCKVCAQKCLYQVFGQFWPNDARAHDEDVHVVVFDTLMGGIGVMADGGTNAFDLVSGNAYS